MGYFNAYKETRLNLDPSTQGSTIGLRLPQHGASTWHSRGQKQPIFSETSIAEDESAFRQKNLATGASIYQRTHHKTPKSFLWRILEDGRVLSIRAVDISKQTGAADFNLTLRLYFTDPIKPGCVAFSDSKEHDVLSAFVLTEKNHLYTLSLRPEHFKKPSSTEDNIGDWCKSYLSGQFGLRKPFRLVALSADELLVSYQDGELSRLSRKSGGDGEPEKISSNVLHANLDRFNMGRVPLPRKSMVYRPELLQGKPYGTVRQGVSTSLCCNIDSLAIC